MKIRIRLLLILICALSHGAFAAGGPTDAGVVAWGDSLTYGTGAVNAGGKSWPEWFAELTGANVVNKGVGGQISTQIKARMLAAPELHKAFTVIWAGRNNAYATDAIKADIAEMVAALGHDNYLVIGITNGADEIRSADPNYPTRWKLQQIDKVNAALKQTYGKLFVDVRPLLVAAADPNSPKDAEDAARDVIPSSLKADTIHLNSKGYKLVAEAVHAAFKKLTDVPAPEAAVPTSATAAAATELAEKTIVNDTFDAGRGSWEWAGTVKDRQFVLAAPDAKQWSGGQTLLKDVVQIGGDAGALHLRFTIEAIEIADGAGAAGVNAEVRIFLTPAPLKNPTFADPFSEPSALTLIFSANAAQNTLSIRAYEKTGWTKGGYGWPALYEATAPLDVLPLTLDWHLSKNAYKLAFSKPIQSVDGMRANDWKLGPAWNGELRYIMRVVNLADGAKSQLRLSNFSLSRGPLPVK